MPSIVIRYGDKVETHALEPVGGRSYELTDKDKQEIADLIGGMSGLPEAEKEEMIKKIVAELRATSIGFTLME